MLQRRRGGATGPPAGVARHGKGRLGGRARSRGAWAVVLAALAACAGGGGAAVETAGSPSPAGPAAPTGVTLSTANAQVLVDWTPAAGATAYRVYWSTSPSIDPTGMAFVQVSAPPHLVAGAPGDVPVYCVVTSVNGSGEGLPSVESSVTVAPGSPQKYFPPWADAGGTTVMTFNYNAGQTAAQNGAALKSTIAALSPGDELRIGDGTYVIDSLFDIQLVGTAGAPIRIVAAPGANPTITRSNASQNVINIGSSSPTRYLLLRGLEVTGGSAGIRLFDCQNVWIDQCWVHDIGESGITANTVPTQYLWFTRNEIHGTSGTGEGFYLGGNNASPITHHVTVALNHVHHTGGTQGDGIELKEGSWGSWIAENLVHDTKYPCILVYGTGGQQPNLIERNLCWGAQDNVMQVQGEAIVRNNVAIDGSNAFYSANHQGTVTDLVVVNNTFVNDGRAARLQDWGGKPGMVFANNACYSQTSTAILVNGGNAGVTFASNVVFGTLSGVPGGTTIAGTGLGDFDNVSWDGTAHEATPSFGSVLLGAGGATWVPFDDLQGKIRTGSIEAGALDHP